MFQEWVEDLWTPSKICEMGVLGGFQGVGGAKILMSLSRQIFDNSVEGFNVATLTSYHCCKCGKHLIRSLSAPPIRLMLPLATSRLGFLSLMLLGRCDKYILTTIRMSFLFREYDAVIAFFIGVHLLEHYTTNIDWMGFVFDWNG